MTGGAAHKLDSFARSQCAHASMDELVLAFRAQLMQEGDLGAFIDSRPELRVLSDPNDKPIAVRVWADTVPAYAPYSSLLGSLQLRLAAP